MAKSDRILNFFPAFYRATDRTKLLYEVVRRLAQPLEEANTYLFRIQWAHRIQVAEHVEDIIRLAATLNLTAFHFEDILTDDTLAYKQKLDLMRERVQRIAKVHLTGLGTPWAVMESTAIFLNATLIPEHPGDPLIKHIDEELYSHKAVIEFSHLPEKPRERIYLYENPFRRKKVEPIARWPMNIWAIENKNVEASPIKLVLQGIGDRTVLPSIFCPTTAEGILFNGIIPDGKTLVIDESNGALLDNRSVDRWLIYFKGGNFDSSRWNGGNFVQEQVDALNPFDGNLENLVSGPFQSKKPPLTAPPGRSEWYFKVAEGTYDGSNYDFSVYVTNPESIGIYDGDFNFDACVFDFPASGILGMAWDERIPCSFKLVLPANIPQKQNPASRSAADKGKNSGGKEPAMNSLSRIGNILPRFKAAGIRAFVDTAKDVWILGESVIRDPTITEGEGIEIHATRLQNPKADAFVPLDTTPSS
jgi:hypothetical protein